MWFRELRNCVVVFEGNFDICVFEEDGDFSDILCHLYIYIYIYDNNMTMPFGYKLTHNAQDYATAP